MFEVRKAGCFAIKINKQPEKLLRLGTDYRAVQISRNNIYKLLFQVAPKMTKASLFSNLEKRALAHNSAANPAARKRIRCAIRRISSIFQKNKKIRLKNPQKIQKSIDFFLFFTIFGSSKQAQNFHTRSFF